MAGVCADCSAALPEGGRFCPACGASTSVSNSTPPTAPGGDGPAPALPPRYAIRRFLGRGGMGRVYLCHDEELDVEVAIKVLPAEVVADAEALEQIRREARASAKFRGCAGILALYGFERTGETCYLVMEYAAGGSLADRLKREARLPETDCRRLGAEVAEALAFAHRKKVLHRDVKPANILLDGEGRTKVADFGIARIFAETSTRMSLGTVSGTPLYMPPEIILRAKADGRADLYSLGCMLYEMATGEPPFDGTFPEIAMAKTAKGAKPPDPRERVPSLSPAFSTAVRRLLAVEPGARFPDGDVCAAALRAGGQGAEEAGVTVRAGAAPATLTKSRRAAGTAGKAKRTTGMADPLIGAVLSDCRIIERIGRGTFGAVYRAEDQVLHRSVAIKVLDRELMKNEEFKKRFVTESIIAANLNHPHIVTIHKLGRDERRGLDFAIMEYLEGGRILAQIVREEGPLEPRVAVDLALQIAGALAAAHDRNILHGNLKPENVMVDGQGAVKVLDFALTRAVQVDMVPLAAEEVPWCSSPEHFNRLKLDARADIYALGVTLYFLLAGRYPYTATTTGQLVYAIVVSGPMPLTEANPKVPAELWPIVRKMIAPHLKNRYADIREPDRALRAWLGITGKGAAPSSTAARRRTGRTRTRGR